MEPQIQKMQSWFAQQIDCCERSRAALAADHRRDEADFEKIRMNVYDIFRTILNVAVNQHGENREQAAAFFKERIERIPSGWAAALEQAKAHDDIKKQQIELIKLETVQKIKEYFAGIQEGQP